MKQQQSNIAQTKILGSQRVLQLREIFKILRDGLRLPFEKLFYFPKYIKLIEHCKDGFLKLCAHCHAIGTISLELDITHGNKRSPKYETALAALVRGVTNIKPHFLWWMNVVYWRTVVQFLLKKKKKSFFSHQQPGSWIVYKLWLKKNSSRES